MERKALLRRIRVLLGLFVLVLVLSGLTAVPVLREVTFLEKTIGQGTFMESWFRPMADWITLVHTGIAETSDEYPFVFYGNDWLAFGHIVIAISLLGALRDPVRNVWVVESAMIACVLVVPVAFICGHFRGIPVFWRLIDCSFGVVGIIPLTIVHKYIRMLEVLRRPIA